MTQADHSATTHAHATGFGAPSSGRSGLVKIILVVLATVAVGLLFWFLPFGQAIVSDTDKRNQRDLAIAASGLETWSDAVRTVAVTNFIRGRVSPLEAGDRDSADHWTHRARFRHPVLGEYKVLYRVGTAADCTEIAESVRKNEGPLPFVRNYFFGGGGMLKVLGDFAVTDIKRQDTQPLPRNSKAANAFDISDSDYVTDILNGQADPARPVAAAAGDLRVCYGAVIQLDRLLIIDRAARDFSNLLVVDGKRRIVAQVGGEPIPLQTLDRLTADGSVLVETLAATVGQQQKDPKTTALIDSLDPVDLNIAGKSMRAYVRPFKPSIDSFPACAAPEPAAPAPTVMVAVSAVGGAPPAAPPARAATVAAPSAAPQSGQCFVLGLMPKATVWRQIANPPLTLVFGLGLAIGLALTLLPSLRLLMLGPREAIGRAEAIGVALGLPAAASLAFLILLFSGDIVAHRHDADRVARAVAAEAADKGSAHLQAALARTQAMAAAIALADAAVAGKPDAVAGYAGACMAKDYIKAGRALPINPRPLECAETPICQNDAPHPGRMPLVESVGLYSVRGFAVPGTRTIACRRYFGGRSQLAGRGYFQRVVTNDPSLADGSVAMAGGPRLYAVDQVMSQPDGLNKTIMAFQARGVAGSNGLPAAYLPGDPQEQRGYVVASTAITDLLTPAVLPPFQLMVVDTRDRALPVIMHSAPNRAGAERLASMLDRSDQVRDQLRAVVASADDAAPTGFRRFYDGSDREFVAAPIRGSRWVVLVHYAIADIDAVPAATARHALTIWAAMSLLFCGGWVAWLWLVGRHGWADEARLERIGGLRPLFERGWPRLWPQEARRPDYDWLRRRLLRGAVVAAALVGLVHWLGTISALPVFIGVIVAVLTRTAAGIALHWRLGEHRPRAAHRSRRALRPETQSAFVRLAFALMLCLSVVPMLAFWCDGRALGELERRRDLLLAIDGREGVVERADRGLEGIFWSFGRPPGERHRIATAYGFTRGPDANLATPAEKPAGEQPVAPSPDVTFAGLLRDIADRDGRDQPVPGCPSSGSGSDRPQLCGPEGAGRGISVPVPGLGSIGIASGVLLLVLAGVLFGLLRYALLRVLKALCGFGIALEAVEYPQVDLKPLWIKTVAKTVAKAGVDDPVHLPVEPVEPNVQTLNRKSLLVNAPWAIRPMLALLRDIGERQHGVRRTIVEVDLSGLKVPGSTPLARLRSKTAALPRPVVAAGDIIIVTGLDLVLADSGRRLLALVALEDLVKQVDALETEDGETRDPYLLFLAPSAPMDRILDAYERERPEAASPDANRENLRWARVFEDFATFPFQPVELTRGTLPRDAHPESHNPHETKAIRTVFEELRWLSPQVVNGCINEERYPATRLLAQGLLPVRDADHPNDSPFIPLYEDIIAKWAKARHFPGRNAALSYIRGQFIEHYQRLWSASTVAERLVMHHLAFGRFVNIGTSLGFAPLVRRGLVVLDPEPRLMNESFAMFVRQAEKLDRIRQWQEALPDSAWLKSRLPIFLVLGLAILALAAMAVLGGQDITALLPVLAAGAPALIAATQRLVRASGP